MSHRAVAVVLAAGRSTRMKSDTPKVLHEVCGRPMIEYVLDAAREAGAGRLLVVVGYQAERVREALAHHSDVEFALQSEQLGTGHAVMMCRDQLAEHQGAVLILAGDTPLLRGESLAGLLDEQRSEQAACVIGTAQTEFNEGLGRIVRNENGEFERIVEQKDATPDEAKITEINTGCYVFEGPALLSALERIRPENQQSEYYLTDCPAILKADGRRVVASCRLQIVEAMGVNTRVQLADVQRVIQRSIQERWMLSGVAIPMPEQTYIDARATIGQETVIEPFTVIEGSATIGAHCRIGPHAFVRGSVTLADGTTIPPFETVSE